MYTILWIGGSIAGLIAVTLAALMLWSWRLRIRDGDTSVPQTWAALIWAGVRWVGMVAAGLIALAVIIMFMVAFDVTTMGRYQ